MKRIPRRQFIETLGVGAVTIGCGSEFIDRDGGRDARRDDARRHDGDVEELDTAGDVQDADIAGPVDPGGPPQFLTWDGGSGPSKQFWSTKLRLRWTHSGPGDYLDADGIEQGSNAYGGVPVDGPGRFSLDVTSLVRRWLESGENRGFYLASDQAHAFRFVGRNGAPESDRPALLITTERGERSVACTCNAMWSPSTSRAFDSREAFSVDSGNMRAIVQFDLTEVVGSVSEAILTLTCTEAPRAGQLMVFEADPPRFRVGGGGATARMGLAETHPNDARIATHPSVLFAADFSDLERGDAGVWSQGSARDAETRIDPATGLPYMRGVILEGNTGSCTLEANVTIGDDSGVPIETETALYARYYVFLEDDWGSTVDANKMPGWDTRMGWWNRGGQYWAPVTGNGGARGSGLKTMGSRDVPIYEGHSIRGHGGERAGDGNYYDELFWLGTYLYHIDQPGPYGNSEVWHGTVLSKRRWTCIEQYIGMNTIRAPFDAMGNGEANHDGVLRVWVDGVLAYERTDLRWTRHPELGLQGFWLNWFHGGTSPADHDMHYRMSSLVIAREYIGPRG